MTKLIAHRGASLLALENTERAFELAGKSSNVYGIETDIWLTLDGIWVCSHDKNPFIDKTININQSKYEDIKDKLISIIDSQYKESTKSNICTLDKYLYICQKYNKAPIIEIKQPDLSKDNILDLLTKVKKMNLFTNASFISFEYPVLSLLRNVEPDANTYDLIDTKFAKGGLGKTGIRKSIASQCNVSVRDFLASKRIVQLIHQSNLKISVWTVDKKSKAIKYQKRGVDFITSNDIDLFNR